MARHLFGLTLSDWTFSRGGSNEAILTGPATITFWNDRLAGTQHTDLQDESGAAITSVTSSDGISLPLGTIPRFRGPDSVTYMWADAGGGIRYLMTATDLGDDVAALTTRVATLEATVTELQTVQPYTLYGIRYDAGAAAYPAIPAELQSQPYLIFIGPPTPSTARTRDVHIDTVE